MRTLRLAAAGVLLPLAACTDRVDGPVAAAPPASPRADVVNNCLGPTGAPRAAQMSVTAHGAVAGDGVDDTCAFQAAVYAGHAIHVPAGTYHLSQSVLLPSHTRVFGVDSTSLVVMIQNGVSTFSLRGDGAAFVDSVTVEKLGFRASSDAGYAVSARSARFLTLQDVVARNFRLLHVNTHLPINVWDGTVDPAATAGLTQESQLSREVRVLNNRGSGGYAQGGRGPGAVLVQYAKDVTIQGNTLDNYQHGIQWWGGDANPARGGRHANPRWLRNALVKTNRVTNTEAGIWGGMGQDIRVEDNYVEFCDDVCLDSEGDVRTTFFANHARNAGHAVLDVFHYATDVTFAWNDVRIDDARFGGLLFHTHNDTQDPGQIRVHAHNNTLRWQRSTGVGVAGKEAAAYTNFSNNTLEDVVIDMIPNNSGGIYMNGNVLSFTRSTGGRPGILAGNNYGPNGDSIPAVNGGWELEIGGNTVQSPVAQSASAIRVEQNGGYYQIDTWIYANTLKGFGTSVSYARWRNDKTFLIEGNQHTGTLPSSATNVTVRNNTLITEGGGGECPPPQLVCDP